MLRVAIPRQHFNVARLFLSSELFLVGRGGCGTPPPRPPSEGPNVFQPPSRPAYRDTFTQAMCIRLPLKCAPAHHPLDDLHFGPRGQEKGLDKRPCWFWRGEQSTHTRAHARARTLSRYPTRMPAVWVCTNARMQRGGSKMPHSGRFNYALDGRQRRPNEFKKRSVCMSQGRRG